MFLPLVVLTLVTQVLTNSEQIIANSTFDKHGVRLRRSFNGSLLLANENQDQENLSQADIPAINEESLQRSKAMNEPERRNASAKKKINKKISSKSVTKGEAHVEENSRVLIDGLTKKNDEGFRRNAGLNVPFLGNAVDNFTKTALSSGDNAASLANKALYLPGNSVASSANNRVMPTANNAVSSQSPPVSQQGDPSVPKKAHLRTKKKNVSLVKKKSQTSVGEARPKSNVKRSGKKIEKSAAKKNRLPNNTKPSSLKRRKDGKKENPSERVKDSKKMWHRDNMRTLLPSLAKGAKTLKKVKQNIKHSLILRLVKSGLMKGINANAELKATLEAANAEKQSLSSAQNKNKSLQLKLQLLASALKAQRLKDQAKNAEKPTNPMMNPMQSSPMRPMQRPGRVTQANAEKGWQQGQGVQSPESGNAGTGFSAGMKIPGLGQIGLETPGKNLEQSSGSGLNGELMFGLGQESANQNGVQNPGIPSLGKDGAQIPGQNSSQSSGLDLSGLLTLGLSQDSGPFGSGQNIPHIPGNGPQMTGLGQNSSQIPGLGQNNPGISGNGPSGNDPQITESGQNNPHRPNYSKIPGLGQNNPQILEFGQNNPQTPGFGQNNPQISGLSQNGNKVPGINQLSPPPGFGQNNPQIPGLSPNGNKIPGMNQLSHKTPGFGQNNPQIPGLSQNDPLISGLGPNGSQLPGLGQNGNKIPGLGQASALSPGISQGGAQNLGINKDGSQNSGSGQQLHETPGQQAAAPASANALANNLSPGQISSPGQMAVGAQSSAVLPGTGQTSTGTSSVGSPSSITSQIAGPNSVSTNGHSTTAQTSDQASAGNQLGKNKGRLTQTNAITGKGDRAGRKSHTQVNAVAGKITKALLQTNAITNLRRSYKSMFPQNWRRLHKSGKNSIKPLQISSKKSNPKKLTVKKLRKLRKKAGKILPEYGYKVKPGKNKNRTLEGKAGAVATKKELKTLAKLQKLDKKAAKILAKHSNVIKSKM